MSVENFGNYDGFTKTLNRLENIDGKNLSLLKQMLSPIAQVNYILKLFRFILIFDFFS